GGGHGRGEVRTRRGCRRWLNLGPGGGQERVGARRRLGGPLRLQQGALHGVLVVVAGGHDLHAFLGAAVGEDDRVRAVLGAHHAQRGAHVGGDESFDLHGAEPDRVREWERDGGRSGAGGGGRHRRR